MKQTRRTTVYDPALGIEAYRLQGFPRPFPPHFHDYYVIGYVEAGTRRMVCGGQAWTVRRGDLLVFQPGEVHACVQAGRGSLSYRGLNVPPAVMEHLAGELTGAAAPPRFSPPVLTDPEAAGCGLCGPEPSDPRFQPVPGGHPRRLSGQLPLRRNQEKRMTMDYETEKCVLILDADMPAGRLANTAAILGITLGR